MAINTGTTASGQGERVFAEAPAFPPNIGKLDVAAIYDRVAQGMGQSDALANAARQGTAGNAQLKTLLQQETAKRELIPSSTQAGIASNQGTVAQTPLKTRLLATQVGTAEQTQPGDIAAQNAKNNDAKLQSDLGAIYTRSGIQYGADQADALNRSKGAILKKISNAPGGVYNEPLTGPNGAPLGSVVGFMAANGPEFHIVPIPFGQLARVNTGIQYSPVGVENDPQTGQPLNDQFQTIYTNAAGGITKGPIVKVAHGQPAPGELYQPQASVAAPAATSPVDVQSAASEPASGLPAVTGTSPAAGALPGASTLGTTVPGGRLGAEFQKKQAEERAKQRTDALADIANQRDRLAQNAFSIGKLNNDVSAEQKSVLGSGILSGMLSKTPLATAAGSVNADLSNFVSQVMSSAKNIRTQREFNAFTGAIPSASDQPAVQNGKLKYLEMANTALSQRNDFKEKALRDNPNLDPDQADQLAIAKFPFPTPPGGWNQHTDGTPIEPSSPGSAGNSSPPPTASVAQSAMVTIRTANGQTGQIPAANLPAAIARGATQVQ